MTTDMVSEILNSPLFFYAISASILAGALCGLLGPYIVWKRLGLVGDAVSHASLTPVALAVVIGINPEWILFPFVLLLSLGLGWLEEKKYAELDSTLAMFFSGFLAFGIIILNYTGRGSAELIHLLLGDILTITKSDLILLGGLIVGALSILRFYSKQILLTLVHKDLAQVEGYPTRAIHYGALVIIGLAVAACLKIMGVVLLTSLFMVPPLMARFFSNRVRGQVFLSVGFAICFSIIGTCLSFIVDWPTGPTIAGIGFLLFLITASIRSVLIKN